MAGEDASVRDLLELRVVHAAPFLHQALEPGIGILHQRIERVARLGAGRLKAVGRSLQRRGFHFLDLDADGLQEVGKIRILEQHADRADQRALLRDDVIGAIAVM